jgi:hypothetical protein
MVSREKLDVPLRDLPAIGNKIAPIGLQAQLTPGPRGLPYPSNLRER